MTPEFRLNESRVTSRERQYDMFLAGVRKALDDDFGYSTARESMAFDLFDAGYSVKEAAIEILLDEGIAKARALA